MFGSEFNKELLISFLNAMFHGEQNVQDVTYLNSEQLGDRVDARRAIFDVYCKNDNGEKFIVEMQNVYHEFFKAALYIILRSPYANRHSVVAIGTFISIRYTPSVCPTSTLPKVCRMPNAGSGTQTIRGQRQRLSRYNQRHKNSGKEEICKRKGKGQSERNS